MTQPTNWTNSKMNPWKPDDNPHQARRIGKTGEEVGELAAVLFRITIQGIDSIDPSSGKTNRQRLLEESADVYAQLEVNFHTLYSAEEQDFVHARVLEKRRQMAQWEAHYPTAVPPVQKVREVVRNYFNGDPDDDSSDAGKALQCCCEVIDHMQKAVER